MATLDQFRNVTDIVIRKLEGGYFHPNMRSKRPEVFGSYHSSGETMFGLDRHAGHDLFYSTPRAAKDVLANLPYIEGNKYQYKNNAAKEFWGIIDRNNAKNKWSWLYIPPEPTASKLRLLAADIMYNKYNQNASAFLTPQARKIVESDNRLLFHFIYGTWNGSGWFRKFATDINDAVAKGITNTDKLVDIALKSRTNEGLTKGSPPNKLIKQGGEKIAKFINDLKGITLNPEKVNEIVKRNDRNWLPYLLIPVLLGGIVYVLINKKIIKV